MSNQKVPCLSLKKITDFLDTYLAISDIPDLFYNGLQVEGKQEVGTIAFAVDAGMASFAKAAEQKADMLIVHHGHFDNRSNPSLVGWQKERIRFLLDNNLSLYVAHLPLDRHREVGNNAQLLKLLDATIEEEFDIENGKNIGWIGKTSKPTPLTKIEELLNTNLATQCTTLAFGPELIHTIAVCSGGGGYKVFSKALEANVDLYLTGDTVDVYRTVQDAKCNVIFAGHYATETVGLKALSNVIQKQLDVKTIFIDLPTGL